MPHLLGYSRQIRTNCPKIEGGMAGVAPAKHETETSKGDAAGHMAYRKKSPL
jgi:hypothetical protein